ncbi:major facilitator superfamily domain-containing protein [Podospora appendiculata]|uniref:Major facilitator superfamily domain-containing protein n=1 Tax=Podospora appendiculata TaxID=314037 RepID=A0AAE1CE30_9PEZI|nr:major facilitator superfamily domain-containing protein [Podospora appendiculata]
MAVTRDITASSATVPHREGPDEDVEATALDVTKLEEVDDPQAEWKPGPQEYAVMGTLAVISLMVALDATILVSVLPTLAEDFGGTTTDAFWAGTSYLLTCAVCQPFIAALSDIFGRKEMLIISVLFFTLGTVLCAPIAKTFAVFFAGRSVQGIGGGGIITMGQVIFADIVPLRQRPKYFSFVLGAWALGSVLGPLIGGLFVEHVFWSWCFYVNFPFCALGLIMVPLFVKLSTEKTSLTSKLARVDWVGGFLFIGGLTIFLVGLSWAGVQYKWKSAQVIAPLIIGAVGVMASLVWESHGAREPFLRPSLFYSSSAVAAYACALFQGLILFCALYYVPFYFTAVRFSSPTHAGLNVFPVTCFLLPGSILISLLTTRLGRFRWAIWLGWLLAAVSCGLLVFFDQNTKTVVWAVILAVFGIGHGMLLTSINVGIQAISHVEDAGRAAAMYAFMRTLGMSVGVAIGGTCFQNLMSAKLDQLGLPQDIAHNSEAFVSTMALMDPDDPVRVGALEAYVHGFHGVYWLITGAACAAFVISLVIKRHSMDKILASKFVLRGGKRTAVVVDGEVIATSPVAICTAVDGRTVVVPEPGNDRLSRQFKDSSPDTESSPVVSRGSDSDSVYSQPGGRENAIAGTQLAEKDEEKRDDDDVQVSQPRSVSRQSESVSEPPVAVPETARATPIGMVVAVAYYVEPGGKRVDVPVARLSGSTCPVAETTQLSGEEQERNNPDSSPVSIPIDDGDDDDDDDATPELLPEMVQLESLAEMTRPHVESIYETSSSSASDVLTGCDSMSQNAESDATAPEEYFEAAADHKPESVTGKSEREVPSERREVSGDITTEERAQIVEEVSETGEVARPQEPAVGDAEKSLGSEKNAKPES